MSLSQMDLTMTNVLIKHRDGGPPRAVIADFGISHIFPSDDASMSIPYSEPFPVCCSSPLVIAAIFVCARVCVSVRVPCGVCLRA